MTKARIKSTGKIVDVISRFMPKKRNAPSRDWVCNLSDGTCINESEIEYLNDPIQEKLNKKASEYANKHYSEWEEHWYDYNGYNTEPENDKLELIDAFIAGAEWQYQKDRGEFAKIKAKTWCEGFDAHKKQKEQKPAEWSEDWREEDIQTRFAFYTYKDDSSVLYLSNVFVEETSRNHGFGTRILKAAEKVAETIGATTISLKVKQDSYANAWYRKNGYGYVAFEDGYDWLEKNLEYMKPNKQEWSDEDEEMLNSCISSIEESKENRYAYKETDGDTSYDHEIAWLKSLRPSWKPSEHQMSMLLAVINDPNNAGSESCHLSFKSLYNDLKKL